MIILLKEQRCTSKKHPVPVNKDRVFCVNKPIGERYSYHRAYTKVCGEQDAYNVKKN